LVVGGGKREEGRGKREDGRQKAEDGTTKRGEREEDKHLRQVTSSPKLGTNLTLKKLICGPGDLLTKVATNFLTPPKLCGKEVAVTPPT
jgi:hypothetical protein